jgi:hypothetical protein
MRCAILLFHLLQQNLSDRRTRAQAYLDRGRSEWLLNHLPAARDAFETGLALAWNWPAKTAASPRVRFSIFASTLISPSSPPARPLAATSTMAKA